MRAIISLMIALASFATIEPAKAQPAEAIKYYRDAYSTVANNYRKLVRRFLSADQRHDLDRIAFKFVPSQDIIAQAYITGDGWPVIEVSFGFLVFMENLTLAFAVTGEADEPECYLYYLDATAGALLSNTRRRLDGQTPGLIPFFPHYVQSGGQGCHSISVNDLQNPEALSFIAGGMDSILAVLIGHEIAHHLLGHVDGGGPADLDESRRHETAADIWAVEHAFAIGINPSPAIPIWSFFAATGGADIGDELESTHPLGIRRWADALDRIVQRMQSPYYMEKFGKPVPEYVLEDIMRARDSVRELVP